MGERPPVLIGERVLWLGSGSGLPKAGKVKWIGRLPEMGLHWAVGIELDEALPFGGIDGTWGNRKLFKCRHKHGLIVPHSSVIPQPQQSSRESDQIERRFPQAAQHGTAELQTKSGKKARKKLVRALSNSETSSESSKLELPSTHLRNPNLERQLAILGTLRRARHADSGRLEGVNSEACLYSDILEKEENVFRERRSMILGREFKRSDDTLDRTFINSSRSTGSRRDRSSGIFSFLRWFKKERDDGLEVESPFSGSPVLQRASGSITGSIDTLFSTATTRSFAFVPPNHYRPYGNANPPEIRICPGPETNTYKNRIRQRDLLRQRERNVSLSEKYRLYASETLPRSVDRINEITEHLEQTDSPSESKSSSIRRQKRPAPPPPIHKNTSSSERDLPSINTTDLNHSGDGRQHRRTLSEPSATRNVKPCHVKGKRKAPQPPQSTEQPGSSDRTLSLQRRKRRAPPPPIQRSPSDEITDIFRQAVDDISGSTSSLSYFETVSTASTIDISQAEFIATDTLRLEKGYLKPNREGREMEVRYTPSSPVSPRPWYKRSAATRENSFSRSNDRKRERDRRRVEDWMIESGIPRRPNHLPENRLNIFSKLDKTEEKRRSQISILTNISELDREAAEIVQRNKEKQQALLANHNNRFYEDPNTYMPANNGYFSPDQRSHHSQTSNSFAMFNSITNVTNITVNSPFHVQNRINGKVEHNKNIGVLEESNNITCTAVEKQVNAGEPIVTMPQPEPGPSGIGHIAKVTIEELDDFDKERNSRAQALYEANRLQRHMSPPIPTIVEASESTVNSPGSTAANTPADPSMPLVPSDPPSQPANTSGMTSSRPELSLASVPLSALRPVVHVVWNCPRCTLENPRWKITCDACDMWRPVPCEFKEVTPKHPLPLAVLRIVEPSDKKSTPETSVPTPTNELSGKNKVSSDNHQTKNENSKQKIMNLNIKEEKTRKTDRELTISGLLFNTKSNVTSKDDQSQKDILNGLVLPSPSSSRENKTAYTNKHYAITQLGSAETKQTNSNKQPISNGATPSGSGSSISSSCSSKSDKPVANELQRSPKIDTIEPEEIRRARLAFFEKLIPPTANVKAKPTKSSNQLDDGIWTQSKVDKPSNMQCSNTTSKPNNFGPQTTIPEFQLTSTEVRNLPMDGLAMERNTSKKFEGNKADQVRENKMLNGCDDQTNQISQSESKVSSENYKAKDTQTTELSNKSISSYGQDEDKAKLCELLIEMKHSLPKRSKEEKSSPQKVLMNKVVNINARPDESPKLGAIRKSNPVNRSQSKSIDIQHEPSNQAEAYLVESETIVEEIKIKKPFDNASAPTSAVVRQISPQHKPAAGKEVVVPITIEENTIENGVLYTSVSKGSKKIGSGIFQLMRPRDFARKGAIKTGNNDGNQPVYANVTPLPKSDDQSQTSKEVEQLTLQLTEPHGLAHFRAGLANNGTNNVNTIAVNRLLRRLESAIANGQHELAAALAKELAQLKVNCVVTRQRPDSLATKTIQLDIFVEDKETHQGPFSIRLKPTASVGQLKLKVEREYEIPCDVQRWIIGKVLANDDNATLQSLGITESGATLYLYLVVPDDPEYPGDMGFDESQGAVGGGAAKSGLNIRETTPSSDENDDAETTPAETSPLQESVEPMVQSDETSKFKLASDWKCNVCTLINDSARPKCSACGFERQNVNIERLENEAFELKALDVKDNKHEAAGDDKKQVYQKLVDLEKSDLILSVEVFECPICMVEYEPQEGVVLRECLHVFCRACLANTIEYSEEAEVKCPFRDKNYTCDSTLLEREIKALVTAEAYEQHLAKSIALAETKIGNTFHCKTPDCKGWCIFEDNVNLFRCPVCTHTNCLTCQAIHEGLDCKQFQEQLNEDSEINVESKRTKEMLQEMVDRGEAMNCPTCQVVLMKKWGCDWLRCSMCKTEICWITRGHRWGPNGKGDTSGGCQCGVNGVKCHPKCTYCH